MDDAAPPAEGAEPRRDTGGGQTVEDTRVGNNVVQVQGTGGVDGRNATVDLDASPPRVTGMVNDPSTDSEDTHWSFPLKVTESDPEVLYLWAGCHRHDCRWTAELHYVADGRHASVPINDGGRRFRTVGSVNSERHKVENGRVVPGDYL